MIPGGRSIRDRDMLVSNDTRAIWVDEYALWFGGEGGFSHYSGLWTGYTTVAGLTAPGVAGTAFSAQQALGQIQAFTTRG